MLLNTQIKKLMPVVCLAVFFCAVLPSRISAQDVTPTPTPTDSPTPTPADTPSPSPTPTGNCTTVPNAPVLSSVVSNANNQATVTWVDVADAVSNYLISYGVAAGKYVYGNSNVGGQGTTSFTIGSLTGNKIYYFAVAATNGCGQGSFSNEKSVTAKPIPPTPAPTTAVTPSPDASQTVVSAPLLTETPAATDTPSPVPSSGNVNSNLRGQAIAALAIGFALIGGSFLYQKLKKKNSIPPLHGNSF